MIELSRSNDRNVMLKNDINELILILLIWCERGGGCIYLKMLGLFLNIGKEVNELARNEIYIVRSVEPHRWKTKGTNFNEINIQITNHMLQKEIFKDKTKTDVKNFRTFFEVIYIHYKFQRYLPFIISWASLTTLTSFFIFNSVVWLLSSTYTEMYANIVYIVLY